MKKGQTTYTIQTQPGGWSVNRTKKKNRQHMISLILNKTDKTKQ